MKISRYSNNLQSLSLFSRNTFSLFFTIFLVAGIIIGILALSDNKIYNSQAADVRNLQAESGTTSGGISVKTDIDASGGKYIVFGQIVPSPTLTLPPASTATPLPPVPTTPPSKGTVKAFPEAEGYGKETIGGRGGRVIYVTSLADSGPGTLRDALMSTGPRMILFKVSGTIDLNSMIDIKSPNFTIAGQTAPNQGVQIKGGMLKITTNQVIIRYLKVRPGNTVVKADDEDPISLSAYQQGEDVSNVIIDHSSLMWGPDLGGIAILKNVHDVTVQNTLLGEGLWLSKHAEGNTELGGHSMSTSVFELDPANNGYGNKITFFNNLLTTSSKRMPEISGAANLDFINNVIYNWEYTGPNGNPRSMNFVKNMLIMGPMSTQGGYYVWRPTGLHNGGTSRDNAVFEAENKTEGNGFKGVRGGSSSVYVSTRFPSGNYAVPEQDPTAMYTYVVNNVGANKPVRDAADRASIDNLVNRTGRAPNGEGNPGPNPVWPDLTNGGSAAPADNDNDGMPDAWETQYFGSTTGSQSSASNSNFDKDGDGYTDLEEYLNNTNPNVKN